ncbi:hypothetical protein JN00_0144 [Metamycoplasma subdolum]|uniref:Lipoprotein n=1 Tax=Metamycoplasma subdolum TaxID=92407 RepID=A0A3M0A283_9BACT|nr:hypothetical protein [Metamycoplasma subdolum]RMA79093.1 hypothetical protein JN00_0144 [Metamycoplasma subdolum]WPB50616.1 hypothetical protein R9C05_00440 [Metamycoplasma subdolum]
MKTNKILLNISLISLPLIPTTVLAASCKKEEKVKKYYNSKGVSYKDIKLNSFYEGIEPKDYAKIGKLFYKKTTLSKKHPITGALTTWQGTYWEKFNYRDMTVTGWSDGDTLKADWIDGGGIKRACKIRISGIDTLEEGTPTVKRRERALAALDHRYANSIIPKGAKIRAIAENWANSSYDRLVANIFFDKPGEEQGKFYRNFSTEMLAGGWTLPRFSSGETGAFTSNYNEKEFDSPFALMLPYMAYAFNEGIEQNRGFYNPESYKYKGVENDVKNGGRGEAMVSPYEFTLEYVDHGIGMIANGGGEYILSAEFSKFDKLEPNNSIFAFIDSRNKQYGL